MSDLISRAEVMNIIQEELSLRCGHEADIALFSVKKKVSELPTAFDTERVVEQLEERTLNSKSAQTEAIIGMCGASANYYHGEADAYINAIDIVKKGGVE